jgi:hypothetical protein
LPGKAWLALAVIVTPSVGEVYLNPTNIQWITSLGLILTCLKKDPVQRSDWVVDIAFLVFAGLSGPFIILLSPLFAARAIIRKSAASIGLFTIATVIAGVQLVFILRGGPDHEFSGPFSLTNLLANISLRLPSSLFIGEFASPTLPKPAAIALGVLILSVVTVAAATCRQYRWQLGALLAFALILLATVSVRKRIDLWGYGEMEMGERYLYVPNVLLLWTLGVVAVASPAKWARAVAACLIAGSLLLNGHRFKLRPYADHHWYSLCPEIRAGRLVEVPINPGWKFLYRRGSMESARVP